MSEQNNINNNKRIAKNTLLLYGRMFLLMVVNLFTSRVNLHALGVNDFGIYNVVGGVVAMFSMFSGALAVSISRNITYELGAGNREKLNKVFSTAVNIQVGLAIFIVLLAEVAGVWFLNKKMIIPEDRLVAANWVMQCSIFTFIINLISVPYNAAIIAHEKMSAFAYISILEATLKLGVAYVLYISPADKLITFAILLTGVAFFLRLIYGIYCKCNFDECTYRFVYDSVILKEMLGFAGWSMFGLVAYTGYTYGLNVILNLFFGPAVNAARGIAVQVQTAVQGFSQNFQMALNPQIIKNYAAKNMERTYTLIFASSKYCYYLLLFFALPIILEAPMLLKLWLDIVPDHTVNFLRLIMMIITFDSLGSSISTAQQATGKIKVYQIVVGGIMLAIVPIAFVWLKMGGEPETVYIVYFAACLLAHISRLLIIKVMIKLSLRKYITEVMMPIVMVSIIAFIIPTLTYLYMEKNILGFFVVCAVSVVSEISVVYLIGLKSTERQMINNKISERFSSIRM